MSICAEVEGQVIKDPLRRTGRTGRPFTLVRVRAFGEAGECSVSVIAFGMVGDRLAACATGDRLTLTGQVRPSIWRNRDGVLRAGLEMSCDAFWASDGARSDPVSLQESAADRVPPCCDIGHPHTQPAPTLQGAP